MFDQLNKENHDKYMELLMEKRLALAQEIGNAATIEEARAVIPKIKELDEELKKVDEEQTMLRRYHELYKRDPNPEIPVKSRKGISLT